MERIKELALKHPAYGCNRLEAMLALEGRRVSSITIQKILDDNGLGRRHDCWLALAQANAGKTLELSAEQTAFLEKRNPCFRERHVESAAPGDLLSADTFLVGTLKGGSAQAEDWIRREIIERYDHLGHLLQSERNCCRTSISLRRSRKGSVYRSSASSRNAFTLWDSHTADLGSYSALHEALAQEYGLTVLAAGRNAQERVDAFLAKADIEHVLDAIEVAIRVASQYPDLLDPSEAIKELNHRFREHGVGYQFEESTAIKVDSTYIHKEAVRPALTVLRAPDFKNAEARVPKGPRALLPPSIPRGKCWVPHGAREHSEGDLPPSRVAAKR